MCVCSTTALSSAGDATVIGQLGQGDTDDRGDGAGEMGDTLGLSTLGTGRTAIAITAGGVHTCALLDNGTVKCWGATTPATRPRRHRARGDGAGEMGDSLGPVDLGTGRTAIAIAAGDAHTCALLDDGTVKCWGLNVAGQLGQGDTESVVTTPGRWATSCAVNLGAGRTATRSPPATSIRARCSTTTPSSAGGCNASGSSATATPTTAATTPARWATSCGPSILARADRHRDHRRRLPFVRSTRQRHRQVLGGQRRRAARPRRHGSPW